MNRRSFLGWLGASPLALYVVNPIDPRDGLPSTELTVEDDKGKPLTMGSSKWVVKNEGDKPMVIHYLRGATPSSMPDRPDPLERRYGRFASGRETEALLLPGEELTITAVEMKL